MNILEQQPPGLGPNQTAALNDIIAAAMAYQTVQTVITALGLGAGAKAVLNSIGQLVQADINAYAQIPAGT